ncbi:hypothetical protein [Idiomarina sp. HP20-50]|uniref:hypothetical protein n=1 Tax=Idiomarina sp. HP20-50 TaxID=3070813 RepID=UPI00294B4BE7|nr:hypothetical protein [Idiomarina sp. HP20-50]MDV6315247.1 hypothetical protein [Idiomarina sp. HP20-50]
MIRVLKVLLLTIAAVAISACSGEEPINLEEAKPADVIQQFYHSVYEQEDLEQAKRLSSTRMADLISHYGAVSSVQRYLLGRYFDTVEIEVVSDSMTDYLNNSGELRATVIFEGTYEGDSIKDSRDVVLIEEDGRWVIDRILDARYRP